jgi:hypothetical protein
MVAPSGLYAKEGGMAAGSDDCRSEPSLEELLDDEMMESVLRSAGFDSQGFRGMIAEAARRFDYLVVPDGKIHEC